MYLFLFIQKKLRFVNSIKILKLNLRSILILHINEKYYKCFLMDLYMNENKVNETEVTPWDVKGVVDYDKLISIFGVSKIGPKILDFFKNTSLQKNIDLHIFLKRGLFFAHREFEKIIETVDKKQDFFMYTGRAPGGSMHLGHMIPFLFTKYLQDIFDVDLIIQIPDDEKFMFKKDLTLEKINEMVKSDLNDLAAFGFNPDKTFIFKNTEFIKNMYPLYLKTAKKITYSQARNVFGFENESNIGMISYPAIQIVPTFFEKKICLIPCGIDQNPYFMMQRDIAEGLGYQKNITILSKFLTSLTGPEGKMSASDKDRAILLTDDEQTVKNKINKYAFSGGKSSIDEHRKLGGDTTVDVAYQWLYNLLEEDDEKILKLKTDYESGKLLSSQMKSELIIKLNEFLKKHRMNKEYAIKNNLLEKYMYSGKFAKEMWNKKF